MRSFQGLRLSILMPGCTVALAHELARELAHEFVKSVYTLVCTPVDFPHDQHISHDDAPTEDHNILWSNIEINGFRENQDYTNTDENV
jgi:hypothetical protein